MCNTCLRSQPRLRLGGGPGGAKPLPGLGAHRHAEADVDERESAAEAVGHRLPDGTDTGTDTWRPFAVSQ